MRKPVTRLTVALGGGTWELLPQRAAFWIERRWLVIADAHFGKAATFRARGVPVPQGTTADNLDRLDRLIDDLRPTTVVFLGDLFHAREAHAPPRSPRSIAGANNTTDSTWCWSKAITISPRAHRPPGSAFVA